MTNTSFPPRDLAFRIAVRWPHYVPTPQQLMAVFRMDRATAYRYVTAYRAARRAA